jgi:hypothetical protein
MAENGGYWRSFSFDVSFLERITRKGPKVLAQLITHTEREFFLGLTPGDFKETEVKTLSCHLDATRSSTLANDIIACFAANSLLLRHIVQLVKVSWLLSAWLLITKHVSSKHLHFLRNYNSEAAILTALQKAQILPAELSTFSRVINSDNGYASYLELWFEKPGLPYLHAHFQARSIQAGSKSEFLQEVQGFASMIRIERPVRVRRKAQYCCSCSRRRKYDSEQFCTCGHERCKGCKKGIRKTTQGFNRALAG